METWKEIQARQRHNQLVETILERGLKAPEFEKTHPGKSVRITHTPSGEWFDFGDGDTGYVSFSRPGMRTQDLSPLFHTDWDGKLGAFRTWGKTLKDYLDAVQDHQNTPDLWALLQAREVLIAKFNAPNDNLPFTLEEQYYISNQLSELRSFIISAIQPGEEDLAEVSSRIQYLEEASTRIGRKDWNGILIATLFSLVIAGVFAPERTHELFAMSGELFKALFVTVAQISAGGV